MLPTATGAATMTTYRVFDTYGSPMVIRTDDELGITGVTWLTRRRHIHTADLTTLDYPPSNDLNWHATVLRNYEPDRTEVQP